MRTLLLDPDTWAPVVDANNNIAVADEPYAIAQDVASAVKLFAGELYYDNEKGVPYFERIFGEQPDGQYINAQVEKAALTVPGVVSAKAFIVQFKERALSGQVQVVDLNGTTTVVNL